MISHKHKCILVHVPKCGGSSMEELLITEPWGANNLYGGFIDQYHNKYQTGGLQHLLAKQILREVGDKIFFDYFKFGFVRNPWSKLVSCFNGIRTNRPDLCHWLGINGNSLFLEFLESLPRVKVHVQWESQYKFFYNESGKQLVDFIGKFENLQQDFDIVCDRIGIPRQKLPHSQKSPVTVSGVDYTKYYNDETKQIVETKYKKDIEQFEYEFGN